MSDKEFRTEKDSMGELQVPAKAKWGAQTQRAVNNFPISGLMMPRQFIAALGLVKWAAAGANAELGLLGTNLAISIQRAALQVASGEHDAEFPIDVFQTGSGTSSNMNANEVIAFIATAERGSVVHPNDHVNMCQSSNDVIPTCVHVSAAVAINDQLLPALQTLSATLEKKADELRDVVKTGRTHLMDAMPVTLGQELDGWRAQVDNAAARLRDSMARLTGAGAGRYGRWHRHQCAPQVRHEGGCIAQRADRNRISAGHLEVRGDEFPGYGGRGLGTAARAGGEPDKNCQ